MRNIFCSPFFGIHAQATWHIVTSCFFMHEFAWGSGAKWFAKSCFDVYLVSFPFLFPKHQISSFFYLICLFSCLKNKYEGESIIFCCPCLYIFLAFHVFSFLDSLILKALKFIFSSRCFSILKKLILLLLFLPAK